MPAVIEAISNDSDVARVKYQKYDGLPLVETVGVDGLCPLEERSHFVVQSARRGDLARRTGVTAAMGGEGIWGQRGAMGGRDQLPFLTPTEKEILDDCVATSQHVTSLLEKQRELLSTRRDACMYMCVREWVGVPLSTFLCVCVCLLV